MLRKVVTPKKMLALVSMSCMHERGGGDHAGHTC
jgi:hypothetical protein